MQFSKDMVAAFARPAILCLLRQGESYGYEIIQKVKELSNGEIQWTDGMLYPILHRLEEEELIQSRWGESETGRKRKYYSLTKHSTPAIDQYRMQWTTLNEFLAPLWATQKP
ncbi:MAG: helix-turn-helix transcriptional regulator [Verrucomicrobia bacterium]|nr:helix-turn-helix transcriptional regulator [Verrucomicrobiota bacterium]